MPHFVEGYQAPIPTKSELEEAERHLLLVRTLIMQRMEMANTQMREAAAQERYSSAAVHREQGTGLLQALHHIEEQLQVIKERKRVVERLAEQGILDRIEERSL